MKSIKYTDLVTFADRENFTYREVALSIGMNYQTFHSIIRGHSNPGKKARRKLDAYIRAHRAEIEAALKESREADRSSIARRGGVTAVHGDVSFVLNGNE